VVKATTFELSTGIYTSVHGLNRVVIVPRYLAAAPGAGLGSLRTAYEPRNVALASSIGNVPRTDRRRPQFGEAQTPR